MGSSPAPFGVESHDSFLSIFDNMRHDTTGSSLQSSPLRPNESSTSYFDDAIASPFTDRPAPSKTPISRLKSSVGAHAFLTSPMNTYPSLGASLQASILKQPTGSPLSYRRDQSSEDVPVADPMDEPTWDHSDATEQDLSAVFSSGPFSSPVRKRIPNSVPSTPPPPSIQRVHVTPTSQTPRIPVGNASAPSTLTRHHRSLSGLGTPSIVRSPLRPRQVTDDPSSFPPSPSGPRRRHNSGTSLTTRAPLARAASHGAFPPPFFPQQDRNVSIATSRTASSSYELQSPRFGPITEGAEYEPQQVGNHILPDLVGSRQLPSPQVSQGHSPLCTPTQAYEVYYQSPETHQTSLMSGINQVMGHGSQNNSVSMSSVASFPGNQGFRQSTLGTIDETPSMMQGEVMPQADQIAAPGSYDISQAAVFHNAEYPPVPNMRASFHGVLPSAAHPANIHAWAAQTVPVNTNIPPHPMYGVAGPVIHQTYQRHASGSFYANQPSMPSHMLAPPVTRSFSAPHMEPTSSMSSMSGMPMSQDTSGLFGPSRGNDYLADGNVMMTGPSIGSYGNMGQGSSIPNSTVTSPDTPRKRHPSVGTRLKPGPKPKTPKKLRSASNPVSSPVAGSASGLINFGGALSGSGLSRVEETGESNSRAGPSQSKPLELGPELAAFAEQRPPSAPIVASMQSATQPQLVIEPPRATGENSASGLPRQFLEKLYATYLSTEGSATGLPVKRFKCLIEGCERTFPRKSAIHSHIQTHLEDKPFQCDVEDW